MQKVIQLESEASSWKKKHFIFFLKELRHETLGHLLGAQKIPLEMKKTLKY